VPAKVNDCREPGHFRETLSVSQETEDIDDPANFTKIKQNGGFYLRDRLDSPFRAARRSFLDEEESSITNILYETLEEPACEVEDLFLLKN